MKTEKKNLYTIGITGSMGSGKSTVSEILKESIPVTDCDAINRELQKKGASGWKAMCENNLAVLDENGSIDTKKTAALVFADPKKRKQLESLLHPLIEKEMILWMERQQGICAVEVPLLFESGMDRHFDETWCVYTDDQTAIERLTSFRDVSKEDALARLKAQMPVEKKRKLALRSIENSSSREDLQKAVEAALEQAEKAAADKGRL
jgi:dephospho-CoA kinase